MQHNVAAIPLQSAVCCGPRWLRSGSRRWWSGWRRRGSRPTPLRVAAGVAGAQALVLGQTSWSRVAAATIAVVIASVAAGCAGERSILRRARGFRSRRWAGRRRHWAGRSRRWAGRLVAGAPLGVASRIAIAKALVFTQAAWFCVAVAAIAVVIAIVATTCANKRPIAAVCRSLSSQ
jgi:hypothetical protein